MSTVPKIAPAENGPLIVTDLTRLEGPDGTEIACKEKIALCRCGLSAKKPFCDGAHAREGFTSARPDLNGEGAPEHDRVQTYESDDIEVRFNLAVCCHATECVSGAPRVFNPKARPWIRPENDDADKITAAIANCPSGALFYTLKAGGKSGPAATDAPAIRIAKDGPYEVTGGVGLETGDWGAGASRDRYVLCRCGASKTKPFCDGAHKDAGFTDG